MVNGGTFLRGGIPTVRGQVLRGDTFLPRWHPHGSRSSSSWRHFLTAMASPRFAVKFFMAALFHRDGIPTVRGQVLCGDTFLPRWHPHGSRSSSSWRHFFTAMASPRFAVKFFVATLSYRGGIPTVRGQVLHGGTFSPRWHPHGSRSSSSWRHFFTAMASPRFAVKFFVATLSYRGGIPTVRGQVLHGGTFSPRWHPHGSRSSSSWRHFLTAVASPRFAVKFFMATLSYRGGIPTVRGQVLHGGTFLPRWHPHGSRSSSSWRHFFTAMASPRFAVKFFVATLSYRGGIPTVRGQVLHGDTFLPRWHPHGSRSLSSWRHFLTAVASPRFAVKFFVAALF